MSEDQKKSQLELGETRKREPDRNLHRGGRSFYFFDFDDNIAFLTTPLILFHKVTGEELNLSSHEWAVHHTSIGKAGIYSEYEIRWDDQTGTFRCFRDVNLSELEKQSGKRQPFVQDIMQSLGLPDLQWKGPSWIVCIMPSLINDLFQLLPLADTRRKHCDQEFTSSSKLVICRWSRIT